MTRLRHLPTSRLLAPFRARYGDLIHSQDRLHTFIADPWRLASSTTEGLNYPSVGNEPLLTAAETLHTALDAWNPARRHLALRDSRLGREDARGH